MALSQITFEDFYHTNGNEAYKKVVGFYDSSKDVALDSDELEPMDISPQVNEALRMIFTSEFAGRGCLATRHVYFRDFANLVDYNFIMVGKEKDGGISDG